MDHYEEDWHALWWVRADGRGRILDADEPEGRDAIARLMARYPQYREQPPRGPVNRCTQRKIVTWSTSIRLAWIAAPFVPSRGVVCTGQAVGRNAGSINGLTQLRGGGPHRLEGSRHLSRRDTVSLLGLGGFLFSGHDRSVDEDHPRRTPNGIGHRVRITYAPRAASI